MTRVAAIQGHTIRENSSLQSVGTHRGARLSNRMPELVGGARVSDGPNPTPSDRLPPPTPTLTTLAS